MTNKLKTESIFKDMSLTETSIFIIGIIMIFLIAFIITFPNIANAQEQITNPLPSPATATTTVETPQIIDQPTTSSPIASEADVQTLGAETTGTIASVGGAITAGVVGTYLKSRDQGKKVDMALKDKDHSKKLESDAWYALLQAGADEKNKELSFFQVVNQRAFPEDSLDKRTYGEVIKQRKQEYDDWFVKRYMENTD